MHEPWLRGPIPGVPALVAPVLYAFRQAREDLAHHTEGLTVEQLWTRPAGAAPVGFHIRHIAGSVSRLMTYLQGRQLEQEQMAALREEMTPGTSREDLLSGLDASLDAAETVIRALEVSSLTDSRTVGRLALPTTVIGLLVHIAEHTQRHIGQAITTAKVVRGV